MTAASTLAALRTWLIAKIDTTDFAAAGNAELVKAAYQATLAELDRLSRGSQR